MAKEIVETAIDEVVKNLSFKDKAFNVLKKILVILTIVLLLFKFTKWWLNNVRLAWKLQLGDDTWGTLIWVKCWRYLYGFTFGLVAAYLWTLDETILIWLQNAWIWIINVLA